MSRHDSQGFTLVELLIVLMLMGLVMVLVLSGLKLGTRSWEAGEQRQQQQAERYQLQQVLRNLIGQARNLRVRDLDGRVQVAFRGEPEAMIFVAPGRVNDPQTGLYWYRLHRSNAASQERLVLQARRYEAGEAIDWTLLFVPDIEQESGEIIPVEEYPLTALVDTGVVLSYWAQETGRPLFMHPDWIEQSVLPRLIELDLPGESEGSIPRHWPPLAITLEEYSHALRRPSL